MMHYPPRDFARPYTRAHFQLNRDVDQDGKVDIALQSTFSGSVPGAAGYECWFEDNAGQTATVRSDVGKVWFKANTTRSYRVRWRTINWVGQPGPWSAYTSYVSPSPTSGAPSNPTSVTATPIPMGVQVSWTQASENDYAYSDICTGDATSPFGDGSIVANSTGVRARILYHSTSALYFWVRRTNTSGLQSSWIRCTSSVIPGTLTGLYIADNSIDTNNLAPDAVTRAKLAAGAAGAVAHSNLGTSFGSVNAGAATRTHLTLSFKATSNTTGVAVTLGTYTTTIDYVSGQQITITTSESGGGSFSASKTGGASQSGVQLTAVGIY